MEILREYAWPGNVRELRNLIESMVVLSHGRTIEAHDIPAEVRSGRGRTFLPAPIPRHDATALVAGRDLRPELEFIFRTLVDLRVDMDELKREFEAYRRETALVVPDHMWAHAAPWEVPANAVELHTDEGGATGTGDGAEGDDVADGGSGPGEAQEAGVVLFRPGMTMDDLEREAIRVALGSVGGNRRKAAELLGIGERTLYRKISKYGLEE